MAVSVLAIDRKWKEGRGSLTHRAEAPLATHREGHPSTGGGGRSDPGSNPCGRVGGFAARAAPDLSVVRETERRGTQDGVVVVTGTRQTSSHAPPTSPPPPSPVPHVTKHEQGAPHGQSWQDMTREGQDMTR